MGRALYVSALLMGSAVALAAPAWADNVRFMTGPQGGSWYPLGGAIQAIYEKEIAGSKVTVMPGAGIANVKGINEGKAELGFGNANSTVDGVAGNAPFDKKTDNVCHIGTLYFQYFHVVAPADAKINTIADFKGKAIATQQRGNTGEQMTRDALKVYGLEYAQLSKVNFVSYNDAVSLMKDNHIQGFFLITTVPASSVMELATGRDVKVLDIPDDKFAALQKINPGYDKRVIKAGSYPKQAKDVQTMGTWTHLIAACKLPEADIYKLTRALAQKIDDLAAVVSAVKGLTPKDMAIDVGVPYHPGALKYYREAKVK